MGREDPFISRFTAFPAVGEGQRTEGIVNSMGMQVVTDFWTQLALSGFLFHMQMGTEDAGVAFTAAIDDELVSMVVDNNVGYALIPALYEVTPGVLAGATLAQAMLEVDKAKNRYTSGGTAFAPENLNGLDRASFNGSAYVAGGSDIVAAAKSAVPNSVELARRMWTEDALADTIGYPGAWHTEVYSAHRRPLAVLTDASAIVGHTGSAVADMTGYAVLQFAQFAKAQLG